MPRNLFKRVVNDLQGLREYIRVDRPRERGAEIATKVRFGVNLHQ